ncbi:carboxypeptidase-like regulatory domain-containing protein [Kordia sp. YSTF-M3]|uniref:Carboxypeptidase-like regulatory domain-containing protein n=1 Tax=Kordia aestuariivivens TaxID=2759037 RepID=A0ABR7QG66_9FLAO|nr:carboxypeptidase-like regulatory domain-containing protein [Kordia aestuariivivens]MBC8757498.1 carboxypeptidase-like regulatory domain-containing protein [Kordia aestuariivivens]
MRNATIVLITFLNLCFVQAQKNISGTIVNKDTNEPIAYAHLIIPSEKRGTTADSNGKFEFTVPEEWLGKILKITCVGFEDKKIEIRRGKGVVIYMQPSIEFLNTVHVSNSEKKELIRINSFRGKRSIGLGNFSGGAYPSMFARYYPFNETLGVENYLKEVSVFFYKEGRHNAKFRLRVVSSTEDKMPKDDLVDPFIVEVSYKQAKTKVKMPANGIEVPREGFFIVVEHLFIEENAFEEIIHLKVNDTMKVKNIKQKRYAPIFKGIVEEEGESFSYYMTVDGWRKVRKLKMPLTDFKESEVVAPAFKLKLTN